MNPLRKALLFVGVLFTVAVLGGLFLLLTVGHVNLASSKPKTVRLDLKLLQRALRLYHSRHGHFPSTREGFQFLVDEAIVHRLPFDPWGNPYGYELRGNTPRVWSLGADGAAGGEGEDADLFLPEHP